MIPPVIDADHTVLPPYDCFCAVPGLSPETRNDDCVQPLSACAAGKKLCVAKKVAALLKCYSKNEKPPKGLARAKLDACLQKANDKFDGGSKPAKGCFAKLEAKFGAECLTSGDSAAIEAQADTFVYLMVHALVAPSTTLPAPQ